MENQLINLSSFLEEARVAVLEADSLEKEENNLLLEKKSLAKVIETEKRALATQISQTIKKRYKEVTQVYDSEIAVLQEKLNQAKGERKKDKSIKVKGRIQDETAELKKKNKDIKYQIREEFRKEKVPAFCNTGMYYSLFLPSHILDYFKLLFCFVLCYAIVPFGIYFSISNRRRLYLIGIYLACVIVFGGLYILVGNLTKLRYLETLKLGRSLRKDIRNNKRKIKLITKGIYNDRDDRQYALENHDEQIQAFELQLKQAVEQRKATTDQFEKVTKKNIAQELEDMVRPNIEKLEIEYAQVDTLLQTTSYNRKEKVLDIANRYEGYLGRDFLNANKIETLQQIMSENQIASISEAIEIYNNRLE